jgi:hypothetical protein
LASALLREADATLMADDRTTVHQDELLPIRHRRLDPVFVVGHGRSGTSILSTLLRDHLRVAFGTESQFFIRFYQQLSRYGDLTREANRRLLVEDLSRERFFQRSKKYGVRLDVDRAVREAAPQSYAGVLAAIMRQNAECQRMDRWGDKTPEYTSHLPVLRELFPTAQFIHIVRDGRDVALSGYQMHFGAKNAYGAARQWSNVLKGVQAFAATVPETAFLELRYEDLLSDPAGAFAKIIRFLDVEDPNGAVTARVGRAAAADLRAGNFGKWKTDLSAREQDMFLAIAGPELAHYGYEAPAATRSAPGYLGSLYWEADNVIRRMAMREYWADTVYKARLRLRARQLPMRMWRSIGGIGR